LGIAKYKYDMFLPTIVRWILTSDIAWVKKLEENARQQNLQDMDTYQAFLHLSDNFMELVTIIQLHGHSITLLYKTMV